MAMGHHLTQREIDSCLADMGLGENGTVTFDLFFDWWTDSMGMEAIRKKTNRK
jgi:Ca2+-binding EF-hand superfamily protein